jgi:hypothetical protein
MLSCLIISKSCPFFMSVCGPTPTAQAIIPESLREGGYLAWLSSPTHLKSTSSACTSPSPVSLIKTFGRHRCNSAVSIVTWYTYKEGARQTCTNRPSVKLSVCVNNSSLHCFNTHTRVHTTIYIGSVYLASDL